jgi:predicted DNA binding CopG/RHH family protein
MLTSVEAGEWESVPELEEGILRHWEYARNTLKKGRRVNIRISFRDLDHLQALAVGEGKLSHCTHS